MNKDNKEKYVGEPMKTLKEIHKGSTDMFEAFVRASKNFTKPRFTSKVKYGATNFEYANLSEIMDCVIPSLLDEGFFIRHDFYNEDGIHWIHTYLQYKNGNILGKVIFPIAIADKTMQQLGAQITYLKRYSLSIICNVNADADNDGIEVVGEKLIKKISNIEANNIKTLLGNNKTAWEMLSKEYGFTKISEITTNKYGEIVTALKLFNLKSEMETKKEQENEVI